MDGNIREHYREHLPDHALPRREIGCLAQRPSHVSSPLFAPSIIARPVEAALASCSGGSQSASECVPSFERSRSSSWPCAMKGPKGRTAGSAKSCVGLDGMRCMSAAGTLLTHRAPTLDGDEEPRSGHGCRCAGMAGTGRRSSSFSST
jgi:hypothetical protein